MEAEVGDSEENEVPGQQKDNRIPSAFISYSWDNPKHKDWVLALATRLREKGIEVTLDRWHLTLGADRTLFMEKAVAETVYERQSYLITPFLHHQLIHSELPNTQLLNPPSPHPKPADPERTDGQRTNRHRADSNSSHSQPEHGKAHKSSRFGRTFRKHGNDLTYEKASLLSVGIRCAV